MKAYSEMTPTERTAYRIAQNREIDARIAAKGIDKTPAKVKRTSKSAQVALVDLIRSAPAEDRAILIDKLSQLKPLVTFRTNYRGIF